VTGILKRTTLIVRDAQRSLEFYRDVLGMAVWYDDELVLSGRGLAAGGAGDRTRLVIMRAADPVIGMLGLLQFTAPALPEPGAERSRLGIGDVVFVVQTDDVQEVRRRLEAHDARVHAEPHGFEVRGADGTPLRMTSLSFWDPDGYFFEVNERHAG
jgi:catechol 2,3-dioxygenase-like lactoylglutathione lyase family enzyme